MGGGNTARSRTSSEPRETRERVRGVKAGPEEGKIGYTHANGKSKDDNVNWAEEGVPLLSQGFATKASK